MTSEIRPVLRGKTRPSWSPLHRTCYRLTLILDGGERLRHTGRCSLLSIDDNIPGAQIQRPTDLPKERQEEQPPKSPKT